MRELAYENSWFYSRGKGHHYDALQLILLQGFFIKRNAEKGTDLFFRGPRKRGQIYFSVRLSWSTSHTLGIVTFKVSVKPVLVQSVPFSSFPFSPRLDLNLC